VYRLPYLQDGTDGDVYGLPDPTFSVDAYGRPESDPAGPTQRVWVSGRDPGINPKARGTFVRLRVPLHHRLQPLPMRSRIRARLLRRQLQQVASTSPTTINCRLRHHFRFPLTHHNQLSGAQSRTPQHGEIDKRRSPCLLMPQRQWASTAGCTRLGRKALTASHLARPS